MTTPSDHAKALAALRPRTTIRCEMCGTEKEVWLREKQLPRTCSPACRQKLWRNQKKAAATASAALARAVTSRSSPCSRSIVTSFARIVSSRSSSLSSSLVVAAGASVGAVAVSAVSLPPASLSESLAASAACAASVLDGEPRLIPAVAADRICQFATVLGRIGVAGQQLVLVALRSDALV
jgi:hypothetical protein